MCLKRLPLRVDCVQLYVQIHLQSEESENDEYCICDIEPDYPISCWQKWIIASTLFTKVNIIVSNPNLSTRSIKLWTLDMTALQNHCTDNAPCSGEQRRHWAGLHPRELWRSLCSSAQDWCCRVWSWCTSPWLSWSWSGSSGKYIR